MHSRTYLSTNVMLCAGGLPDGWMSNARTFKNLQFLNLADNRLGYTNDGDPFEIDLWCLEGRTSAMGWCPQADDVVNPETLQRMPNLLSLDISGNDFYGEFSYSSQEHFRCYLTSVIRSTFAFMITKMFII